MLYIKKYFNEGLIQMAILLSLCGVRVDLGLEPDLLPSWHEIMLGPTSALTPTQFHNLRNRLEDGHGLHPKSVDLDGFFTARRLLGLVHSLDRLQVPQAELETWLVQREPDPLPVGFLDQSTALVRAPAGLERDDIDPSMESRAALILQDEDEEEEEKEGGAHHELQHSGERGDEEEEEVEDLPSIHRHRREGEGRPGRSCGHASNDELSQNEIDQTSFSLQECLRLLEETFPFTEEQQSQDAGGRGGDLECLSSERDPMLSPIIPSGNLDLELQWQDVLAIMEPENADADMMTIRDVRPEGLQQNRTVNDGVKEPESEVPQLETPWLHDFPMPLTQSEMEPSPFALTPSAELDDHSSTLNTMTTLKSSNANPLYSPPDHRDLLAEDTSEDFSLGLNAEDDISSLNMNLLPNNFGDTVEGSPYPEYTPYPGIHSSFDVSFHSSDSRPTSVPPFPEGNGITQDFLSSPSSTLLVDEEDVEDEDGLPSPLNELLEDAAILDEISLLELALEEGFSPEMAARLEEEGYLDSEISQQENGMDSDHSGSSMAVTEDQRLPRPHQQDGEHEADSDSGLSLDFSHSPASPSDSEASTYSSSSSSSSCVSAEESLLSEYEDEDGKEWLESAHMDVEVTIKEEELEEEMGAVGGGYPNYVKTSFSPNHPNDKMFNGFPWLEHIGHDHTYNQPLYPASSPSSGKMSAKQTKSAQRYEAVKPYHRSTSRHISETKMWSRDEKRARALKVPFSNHLIVNLPVEEFNDLLANFQLTEEQLALIRDIRRRGKNKIAAQNCRKRKMDVLLGLSENVSGLRLYRSRLLREKQEALRKLKEMKHQLSMLYQEVFSRLRDEEGRPLNAMEYHLNFEANGSVTVASRQQRAELSLTKNGKKHREKKK